MQLGSAKYPWECLHPADASGKIWNKVGPRTTSYTYATGLCAPKKAYGNDGIRILRGFSLQVL